MKYSLKKSTALLGAALLAVVGAAWTSLAEDAQDLEQDLFVESLDVNVVNVEVYVTDRDGNRINGLTKDDFVLLVDKQPVAITNFYSVEDGSVRAGLETAQTLEVPERAEIPEPARVTAEPVGPADQRLHLIVYVDNFNLRPFSRNRVIRAARGFLRSHLRPGDEVMLVSYDRSLKIRHPFTKDPALIANALYELEDLSGHRVHFDSDRDDILDMIYEDSDNMGWDVYSLRPRVSQYAESVYNDMAFTMKALREQVEMLAGLPGRKAVLYVSDGLSMRPGEDIFYALQDKFSDTSVLLESHRFDLSRDFQSLVSSANTNRVTFYTVDAAGLRTYSYMDASNHTAGGGSQIDSIHFSNLQSPLHFMAEETGGFAVINTNNFSPGLEKMAQDFGTYYSLGFSPAPGKVGRYHRIKVQLKDKKKGIRLRYRDGYRNKPVDTRMADSAMAALNFGYQQNGLGVQLVAGSGERHEDSGQFLVPFLVRIPIGGLTFLPQKEMQRGRVKLYIAAKDTDGGVAQVQEVQVPIDIPTADFDRAKEQFYHYQLSLLMRQGRQVVAVGVRDEIGAVTGVVTEGLLVGS
ncbi:MAG: VWA domain-containing protein [Acidobacteriota bacterium]